MCILIYVDILRYIPVIMDFYLKFSTSEFGLRKEKRSTRILAYIICMNSRVSGVNRKNTDYTAVV